MTRHVTDEEAEERVGEPVRSAVVLRVCSVGCVFGGLPEMKLTRNQKDNLFITFVALFGLLYVIGVVCVAIFAHG